jgi:hypothetical protein
MLSVGHNIAPTTLATIRVIIASSFHDGLDEPTIRPTLRISGEGGRQDFQRDLTFQPGVNRSPHFPHAAIADFGDDFISAEPRANAEGQLGGRANYTDSKGRGGGLRGFGCRPERANLSLLR